MNHVIPKQYLDSDTIYHIQPSGRFVIGGPQSDAGLTGRKIIVDTYGGWGAHGGGAFSGKDYTKVDRSAAYAARWVAKSLVTAALARRCLVQVSYAIGVSKPLSLHVETYGSGRVPGNYDVTLQEFCIYDVTLAETNFHLRRFDQEGHRGQLRSPSRYHRQVTEVGPAHLQPYRRLWPLRPKGFHLGGAKGAHPQPRCPGCAQGRSRQLKLRVEKGEEG